MLSQAYAPQQMVSGGTTVNQNITMHQPPPDPHTWSHGVAWELQGAV